MKKFSRTTGVAWGIGVVCLCSAWLIAQEQTTPKEKDKVEIKRERDVEETTRERKVTEEVPAATTYIARSKAITGMPVRNKDGQDLGEIYDIVVDLKTGKIRYAALEFGGVLGIGDKLFAIPWGAFTYVDSKDDKDHFVLNVERERLEKAPGFDKDHWPDFADPKWSAGIETYYQPRTGSRTNGTTPRRE